MDRRKFLALGASAVGAAVMSKLKIANAEKKGDGMEVKKIRLKYAPYPGMFKEHAGNDVLDQIKFAADEGFSAFFLNELGSKTVEEQEKISKLAQSLNMTIGPFVAYADFGTKSFVTKDKSIREMLTAKMKEAIEVGKRTGCKWALMVPGAFDNNLEPEYQTANVIENLKYCAQLCEPTGLVIVIEPLNPWRDHPGLFLTKIPQAYQICKAVNSPSCKIINDLYHQQITEGNLIPNIEKSWDQIGAFHLGDNPGRNEPGTGEINYKNIFKYLSNKGYSGVLCMEHGMSKPGKEGERAVIEAYRQCDNF